MLQGIVIPSLVDVLIQQNFFIDGRPPEQELERLRAQQQPNAGLMPSQTTPMKVAKKQRLECPATHARRLDFEGAESQTEESEQVHELGLGVI